MLGVLRGLWDSIGAECLTFYEEDLRTNSTWHKRVLASAAVDCVSEKMEETIREFLGHNVQDRMSNLLNLSPSFKRLVRATRVRRCSYIKQSIL